MMASNEGPFRGRELDWRYTAETPKFMGVLDARAMLPFVLLLFHLSVWMFEVALAVTVFFWVLSLFRITPVEGAKGAWRYATTWGYRAGYIGHRRPKVRITD